MMHREDRLSGDVIRVNNSQLRNSYLDLPPEQVTPWYAALRLFNQTIDQQSIRNKLNSGHWVRWLGWGIMMPEGRGGDRRAVCQCRVMVSSLSSRVILRVTWIY
ncbi:hypothetical protein E2C01_035566 [Portunus trituberculatus]|uniref:Uncharacterized protein n=1 Tax=Portunus trituberculatus TaxID=210409 RepID=A0A5B7F8P5_PORTR|nr:hypothetical protein [Portunus trituberculatus]